MSAKAKMPFRIGSVVIDPLHHQISLNGTTHAVEPRLMGVLLKLASTPGQVWTREQLLAAVWPEGYPNDEGLTQAISQLRKMLGDSARRQEVIKTVPKVGYRLIAAVERDEKGAVHPGFRAQLARPALVSARQFLARYNSLFMWCAILFVLVLSLDERNAPPQVIEQLTLSPEDEEGLELIDRGEKTAVLEKIVELKEGEGEVYRIEVDSLDGNRVRFLAEPAPISITDSTDTHQASIDANLAEDSLEVEANKPPRLTRITEPASLLLGF